MGELTARCTETHIPSHTHIPPSTNAGATGSTQCIDHSTSFSVTKSYRMQSEVKDTQVSKTNFDMP